jgi:hypothetical protein
MEFEERLWTSTAWELVDAHGSNTAHAVRKDAGVGRNSHRSNVADAI